MRRSAAVIGVLATLWAPSWSPAPPTAIALLFTVQAAQPAAAPGDLGPRGQQVFKMVGQVLSELQDSVGGSGGEINYGPVKIEESLANVVATIPNLTITPGKNEPAIEVGTLKLTVSEL